MKGSIKTMTMPTEELYEYAVLYRDKDEVKTVVDKTTVLAKDAEHAKRIALRKLPEGWDDKLDKLEVNVKRSF